MYLCRAEQNGAPRAAQAGRSGRAVGGTFSFFGRKRYENVTKTGDVHAEHAPERGVGYQSQRGYSDTRGRVGHARLPLAPSHVVAAKSARGACGRQRGSKLVVSVRTFDACDRDRTFYWVCELTLGTALI